MRTLEHLADSSLGSVIKASVQKSKDERLLALQFKFEETVLPYVNGIASSMFRHISTICKIAVQFVEDHAVEIAMIVGGAMVGQVKFTTAVNLVWSLFKDISMELIGCVVEDQHTILFKHKTLEVNTKKRPDC